MKEVLWVADLVARLAFQKELMTMELMSEM
jgi:hypothetical protein